MRHVCLQVDPKQIRMLLSLHPWDDCKQDLTASMYASYLCMQAHAQHRQLAFEGYCHLPEMLQKEWYWTERGDQRGPYNVAELFNMAYGTSLLTHTPLFSLT